jgi:hypothetical protein
LSIISVLTGNDLDTQLRPQEAADANDSSGFDPRAAAKVAV